MERSDSQYSGSSSEQKRKKYRKRRRSYSSSSSSSDEQQVRKIQQKIMKKYQQQKKQKQRLAAQERNVLMQVEATTKIEAMDVQNQIQSKPVNKPNQQIEVTSPSSNQDQVKLQNSRKQRSRSRSRDKDKAKIKKWHIYQTCQEIVPSAPRFPHTILHLPIFKKKDQFLQKMLTHQFVLVTGQTGCGKSTQVPRLIYEYLIKSGTQGNILCVQPRRLAVLNLYQILESQMHQKNRVGYQISMQTKISAQTRILFMTNGIFLQRLVHSNQLFEKYPFIILDEVHQRDIDTDFILLAIKRIVRKYPKIRVILMSATIDNSLFKYYFSEDHIDKFMTQQNFYIKVMRRVRQKQQMINQQDDGYEVIGGDSQQDKQQEKMYKQLGFDFMNSKKPCPVVDITQKGKFKKTILYLDTLKQFVGSELSSKWGSIIFTQKYPNTHKELFEVVVGIIDQILRRSLKSKDVSYSSVLVFLPGLLEIQTLTEYISSFYGRQKTQQTLQILQVHSSILTDQLTKKLHILNKEKIKIILATNIAESSITVMGVKYVIDFCLSKEVHFDMKSRMENLQLIWASQASCRQRAGRTGRVCDGYVFRLVQHKFYQKLDQYSTPQIQRSSLDRVLLRIMMIHQTTNNEIFAQPGDVLGTAIQPPKLKHIDQAFNSLLFCGGIKYINEKFYLTPLGRLYIDLPIDIAYSKMLVMSLMLGTFGNALILVAILSQNKNPFRKNVIERFYMEYFELIDNDQRCDFLALIKAYQTKLHNNDKQFDYNQSSNSKNYNKNRRNQRNDRNRLEFDIFKETKLLIDDLYKRIFKKGYLAFYRSAENQADFNQRFKYTLMAGFLNKFMVAKEPIYEDKQLKRAKQMTQKNIPLQKTICLINSTVIKKKSSDCDEADRRLIDHWKNNIAANIRIDPKNFNITLTDGVSFLHFKNQRDMNKLLFVKQIQDNRKSLQGRNDSSGIMTNNQLLKFLGDFDHMQAGSICTMIKDKRVTIDNYSQNRIVQVKPGQRKRFLMTNVIMQQSSRLFCRFTSLLPEINDIDIIAHLLYYPNIILETDPKSRKYESLYLRSKTRLRVCYQLTNDQVQEVNKLRTTLREFLNFDFRTLESSNKKNDKKKDLQSEQYDNIDQLLGQRQDFIPRFGEQSMQEEKPKIQSDIKPALLQEKVDQYWNQVQKFIKRRRLPMMDDNKWQGCFFKECQIQTLEAQQYIKTPYKIHQKIKNSQLNQRKEFMNNIITRQLQETYFSSEHVPQSVRKQRKDLYGQWKKGKIQQNQKLRLHSIRKNPLLCCKQCSIPLTSLQNVSNISNIYFRDLYNPFFQNFTQITYDDMSSYFCQMIFTLSLQTDFKCYGCKNGHHLGIKFMGQKNIKILSFSQLLILYPDGSKEEARFDSLDYQQWYRKNDEAVKRKNRTNINQKCFICDQTFYNYKDLQTHFNSPFHLQNMKDFKKCIEENQ